MATRSYEALYIVRPELKDSEIQKIADKFKKVVEDKGGSVSKAEKWEKRKLAYEIANLKDAEGDVPAELNRLLNISDDIIRHQIVKQEA
jgi:small subunit ribosomal protein S6